MIIHSRFSLVLAEPKKSEMSARHQSQHYRKRRRPVSAKVTRKRPLSAMKGKMTRARWLKTHRELNTYQNVHWAPPDILAAIRVFSCQGWLYRRSRGLSPMTNRRPCPTTARTEAATKRWNAKRPPKDPDYMTVVPPPLDPKTHKRTGPPVTITVPRGFFDEAP